jgi:hypothetical protein
MEQALERTCRSLPHGGDHDLRAFIAERLNEASAARRTTLGELGIVARKALADYKDAVGGACARTDRAIDEQGSRSFSGISITASLPTPGYVLSFVIRDT